MDGWGRCTSTRAGGCCRACTVLKRWWVQYDLSGWRMLSSCCSMLLGYHLLAIVACQSPAACCCQPWLACGQTQIVPQRMAVYVQALTQWMFSRDELRLSSTQ